MGAFFAAIGQAISTFVTFLSNPYTQAALFIASGVQSHRTNKKLKRGQDILLTKFGTGAGIPVVYGTRRVAGTVVFMETVANKELFVVYALAVGEVENISDLRIDGRSINDTSVYRQGYVLRKEGNYFGGTVASENTVDIGNVLGGAGGDNPRMVFNLHHGSTTQEADPMLYHVFDGTNSRPNSWSQEHKLSGIAYIAANYEYDTQGMFTGIPNLTAVVKGKKVLDTRTSTTGWSDNPALILYDYLTNDEYGKGIATSKIDTTSFNTAANDCETDVQTITHSNVAIIRASTDTDRIEISGQDNFNKIKTGTNISFTANSTTYFSGKVISKDNSGFSDEFDTAYRRRYFIDLEDGAVTTAITSSTTGTITETQDRFETNAVINTDESVLENTKDLVANMRGIFNYTNGTYSIKVEGTETPVLNLDEDDILEAGIELSLENKEQKYNRVEVEFYNSSKNYEADTVVVEHSPLSDDGGELLEHRVQFPHVTNQRIAYNHANAILNRSRNNRTISFVATPKVLKAKVGEVITITSSDLGLSQEQYRITQMTIQPDLNIQVSAVEYQGSIYGWNNPPEEPIEASELPPDPYRVEQVTNLNFIQKSGSTPAYLSWTDADGYTSFEFAVKVYDAINQGGNVIRDGRVKENRFYLPELPKANGYSAEVISINTLGIESDPTPLNSFDVTVDPVINDDIGNGAVDTDEINQGAIGGMQFTETKAYYGTGTFNNSNTPFYVDTSSNFSLGSALSFNGTTLTIGGYATDTDIADFITGAEVNANVTSISGGVIQTGTILADRMNVSTISSIAADLGSITAGSINIGSGAFTVSSSGVMTATGATVSGNITATTLNVSGATVTGTLDAEVITLNGTPLDDIFAYNSGTGETTISGSESLTGNLSIGGNLTVTGDVETTGHHNKLVFSTDGKGLKFGDSSILYEWTATSTGTEDCWFGHSNASALIGLNSSKPSFYDGSNFNGIAYKNATSGYVVVGTDVDLKFDSIGVGTAASGTTGEIRATNNITAYYSDARLKDFEGVIPNALEKLSTINGYYFKENDKAKELGYNNPNRQVGVSAQEILDIMPEAVTEAPIDKEYLAVQYDKLVPLLIQAIKELKQEVEELKQ
jgi:Cu/Ag efflux protein CusF